MEGRKRPSRISSANDNQQRASELAMDTPASLFDSYEADLLQILEAIQQKLEKDARGQIGEQKKATLRRVEIELDEADDIISQLEIEIQGIPQSIKPAYLTRLKSSKSLIGKYKKLSRELQTSSNRADLLGGGVNANSNQFAVSSDDPYSDRNRLLSGNATLEDGSRRLQDSTRTALDTEAQGADILTNLRRQREQIEHARDTLNTADTNIGRASGTIKGMIRQMYKQRFIYAGIGVVLIIVIILILYFKLRHH